MFTSGDAPAAAPANSGGSGEADTDKFNEAVFEANRARPLAEVREEWRCSHERVVAAVSKLSEEELSRPAGGGSDEGVRVLESVREDTDAHYRGHISQIEAWLAKMQGAR